MVSRKLLISLMILLSSAVFSYAQTWTIRGKVIDKKTSKPIEYATVVLERTEQWAMANADGEFVITNVQSGKNVLSISCLGYVTDSKEIIISRNIENYKIALVEDNLSLESVVVTAQEKGNTATTSRMIDRNALNHVQMMNVADISGLLPGGVTVNPVLTSEMQFDIRAGESAAAERGSSSFGTAVEVDGVRLSNNASFSSLTNSTKGAKGVTTNNISSSNVESVEVITGVPSVEYGDMTSGVVKINTLKGKTPYIVTLSTNPRTKQVSATKGFSLGESKKGRANGILNTNIEYTKAIGDRMSPYTGYDRKQISLTYSNTFNSGALTGTPLQFSVGVTGNLGGMDSKADPDAFLETFSAKKDNTFRGKLSLNWLLSKNWITNVELNASAVYSDRQQSVRENYSSSSSTAALHGREEGYFVAQEYDVNPDAAINLIPKGYWYNTMCIDDRPLNYKVSLKANWARQWGKINNKVKLGADWTGDGNFGIGQYSEDISTAETFREYRYNEVPFMNNAAVYLEDNIIIPIGKTRLNLTAGLRNDNTIIKGSEYGVTSSISPRFNAKYTVLSAKDRRNKTIKDLSFRASWGVAVKQPSFSVLFPTPTYRDILSFTTPISSAGSSYPAYYILPKTILHNPNLKWQQNRQAEAGMEINIAGTRISLAGYYNQTYNAYRMTTQYSPFSYNYTSTAMLQNNCTIPADNRLYEIDRMNGQVTVHDKTGAIASQLIPYVTKNSLDGTTYATNDINPIRRYGLEWIIDFKRIEAINTTFRLDGSFYGYRHVDSNIEQSIFVGNGTDGEPFKYVGFYYGSSSHSNGTESRSVKTNLTVTTHIPKARIIISMKVQATFLNYQRYLSEKADGTRRSYVLNDRNDILSIVDGASVYDGTNFVVTFPEYYAKADDISNKRNYLEDLKWAREHDIQMYSDLAKLAQTTNYKWHFDKDYISPYFSANISITKEIGDLASISFYANNFFNNFGQVKSSKSDTYYAISGEAFSNSGYAPGFFYGLSIRMKF